MLEAETEEDAQAWVDAISSRQSAGLLGAPLRAERYARGRGGPPQHNVAAYVGLGWWEG